MILSQVILYKAFTNYLVGRVTYQYMAGKATAAIPCDWQSKIN
jgi:hypothetical protein